MIGNLVTADLARLLGSLRARGGTASEAAQVLQTTLVVVVVAPGERWLAEPVADERLVVVLDGLGTIIVDDWRATLGPGLAAGVPAKRPLTAIADTGPLELLVITPASSDSPQPLSAPAPAGSPT